MQNITNDSENKIYCFYSEFNPLGIPNEIKLIADVGGKEFIYPCTTEQLQFMMRLTFTIPEMKLGTYHFYLLDNSTPIYLEKLTIES